MRIEYNKLVRDKVPELIHQEGHKCEVVAVEDGAEYRHLLLAKLVEEAQEACHSEDSTKLSRELADLYEVIEAVIRAFGLDEASILVEQDHKRSERGGFSQHLKLVWVEEK